MVETILNKPTAEDELLEGVTKLDQRPPQMFSDVDAVRDLSPDVRNALLNAEIEDLKEQGPEHVEIEEISTKGGVQAVTGLNTIPAFASRVAVEKVALYSTIEGDGSRSEILVNMLDKTIRRKRDDGKRAFSPWPVVEQPVGTIPCFLSPEHPKRDEFRKIGLHGNCSARNGKGKLLRTEIDLTIHVRGHHAQAWEVIKEWRERKEREETREETRAQTAALIALVDRIGSVMPQVQNTDQASEVNAWIDDVGSIIFKCDEPDCIRFYDNAKAKDLHVRKVANGQEKHKFIVGDIGDTNGSEETDDGTGAGSEEFSAE